VRIGDQNGSVWPHDTALCAAGMANYGYRGAVAHLLSELFAASMHFDTRLPELDRPELPSEIERLAVRDLAIDDARISLLFERVGECVTAAPLGPIDDSIQVVVRA